jgi:hypothetical protein
LDHFAICRGNANGSKQGCKGALSLRVAVEELAGTDLQSASELKDIVKADVLLAALDLADEVPVHLNHLTELLLGQFTLRADGT